MKLKTTKKAIRQQASNLFNVGYCELQYLLGYKNAFAYASGQDGWCCDYYELEHSKKGIGVVLATGYRTNGTGKRLDYNLVKEYEEKAKRIMNSYNTYENVMDRPKILDSLINLFIEEITRGTYDI